MTFKGDTYIPAYDELRLMAQKERVLEVVKSGQWMTLSEISQITHDPEASVSARLRDYRREGWIVHRRRRGKEENGLHEYRLEKPSPQPRFEFDQSGQGLFV